MHRTANVATNNPWDAFAAQKTQGPPQQAQKRTALKGKQPAKPKQQQQNKNKKKKKQPLVVTSPAPPVSASVSAAPPVSVAENSTHAVVEDFWGWEAIPPEIAEPQWETVQAKRSPGKQSKEVAVSQQSAAQKRNKKKRENKKAQTQATPTSDGSAPLVTDSPGVPPGGGREGDAYHDVYLNELPIEVREDTEWHVAKGGNKIGAAPLKKIEKMKDNKNKFDVLHKAKPPTDRDRPSATQKRPRTPQPQKPGKQQTQQDTKGHAPDEKPAPEAQKSQKPRKKNEQSQPHNVQRKQTPPAQQPPQQPPQKPDPQHPQPPQSPQQKPKAVQQPLHNAQETPTTTQQTLPQPSKKKNKKRKKTNNPPNTVTTSQLNTIDTPHKLELTETLPAPTPTLADTVQPPSNPVPSSESQPFTTEPAAQDQVADSSRPKAYVIPRRRPEGKAARPSGAAQAPPGLAKTPPPGLAPLVNKDTKL